MKVSIKYVPIGQEFLDCKGICTFVRAKAALDFVVVSLPNMSIAIPAVDIGLLIGAEGIPPNFDTLEKDLELHPNPEDGWLYVNKENS